MISRNLKIFTILTIGATALFVGVADAQVSGKDVEKIESQVREQALEHKKLQAQALKINLEISAISKEMIDRARTIQNQEETLSKMESEMAKLDDDLKTSEKEFEIQDENLIRTTSALQNLAMKPTESLLVLPLTPVEVIRSAMLLRETIPSLDESASKIRGDLERIEKKRTAVLAQSKKITAQKESLERDQGRLKKLASRKAEIRKDVEIKTVKSKKRVELLASQAKDLRDLFGKIEAQRLAKIKKDEERRKQQIAENKAKTPSPDNLSETGNAFVRAKGRLSMPARGQVVISYGQETAKGVTSKGITIATRNNAQVTALFDGSVIFTGPFRGYGKMIIVEHGGGYLSLLAGLGEIDCEIGQVLLAGEPVGQMAKDGDMKLYLEMRKDNKPINPASWIKK